jgi:REP element-mobilizing transposase RayT
MDEHEALDHTTWDCKYQVVFIPKYRRKILYQELSLLPQRTWASSHPRRQQNTKNILM